jgi:hypothetical protein
MAAPYYGRRAAEQHIIEIKTSRWPSDANATPFTAPPERGIPRRRFAGIITIGEHDKLTYIGREFECAQAGS